MKNIYKIILYCAFYQDRLLAYKILSLAKPSENHHMNKTPHWKYSLQSKWEIGDFRKALARNIEFNNHFEFVEVEGNSYNYIGRGREGIVYLAKEKESEKLMAIKVKCEKQPNEHPYNGPEEVQAVKLFSKATGYPFDAKNFSTFNAKSFIKGRSLEELLKSNELFNENDKSKKMLGKLKELFDSLIAAKVFFADIAPENFVFDGEKFYIIDLRPFKVCSNAETTRKEYKHVILDKADEKVGVAWSQDRWYHPNYNKKDKAKFMKFIANVLDGI